MLYTGKNIRESNLEALTPVTLEELAEIIRYPGEEVNRLLTRMQKVLTIDAKSYHRLKTGLPFFTGADFKGNMRHSNNFIRISWFILDLDHCIQSIIEESELKEKLSEDPGISLMFTSPSGTGLKILFRLKSPMTDTKLFSEFYLAFARRFSVEYGLEKYMDFKTHDVTRVSFINSDANLYLNKDATPVDASEYISQLTISETQDLTVVEKTEENADEDNDEKKNNQEIDKEVYVDIIRKLNPKTPVKKKEYYVPEILDKITQPITDKMEANGITVSNISDIQYGRKFQFTLGEGCAELNIYYGKKGFSVVKTPRNNTIPEFNEAVYQLAMEVIYDLQNLKSISDMLSNIHNKPEFMN